MPRKRPPSSPSQDQRAGLFAAVKQSPEDDTPRLVLADWLEEHGDEDDRTHAELIRVQCEILRRSAEIIDPERPEPIHALLRSAQYSNRALSWLFAPLTHPDTRIIVLCDREKELCRGWGGWDRTGWRRGFASLSRTTVPFRSRDMAALAAEPNGSRIDQLDLNVTPGNSAQIARCALLAHVVGLQLSGKKFGPAELETLLASPHLSRLRRLDLRLSSAGQPALAALVSAPRSPQLTHLELGGPHLDRAGLRTLAEAELPSLQALHLGCPLDAQALARAPFISHLEDLILTGTWIGDRGLEAIVSAPSFRCPARLQVDRNQIGPAGLRALLTAPGLERLVLLDASWNALDDAAIIELASSPQLAGLLHLDLTGNHSVGNAAVEALARSPHLSRLAVLNLLGCRVSEAGARALLDSPHLRRLSLTIRENVISSETLAALRRRYIMKERRRDIMNE